SLRRGLAREVARGAAAVLDDDALLPVRRETVGHDAADDVGRAARGIADQDADRFGRILLSRACRRVRREGGEGDEKRSETQFHESSQRCENIFFPAAGISAVTISPLSESVMYKVLRPGPPNAMLV